MSQNQIDRRFCPQMRQHVEAELRKAVNTCPGLTRKSAALFVLNSKPNWYVQTPEGAYLKFLLTGRLGVNPFGQ